MIKLVQPSGYWLSRKIKPYGSKHNLPRSSKPTNSVIWFGGFLQTEVKCFSASLVWRRMKANINEFEACALTSGVTGILLSFSWVAKLWRIVIVNEALKTYKEILLNGNKNARTSSVSSWELMSSFWHVFWTLWNWYRVQQCTNVSLWHYANMETLKKTT